MEPYLQSAYNADCRRHQIIDTVHLLAVLPRMGTVSIFDFAIQAYNQSHEWSKVSFKSTSSRKTASVYSVVEQRKKWVLTFWRKQLSRNLETRLVRLWRNFCHPVSCKALKHIIFGKFLYVDTIASGKYGVCITIRILFLCRLLWKNVLQNSCLCKSSSVSLCSTLIPF